MHVNLANELADTIAARFQMLGSPIGSMAVTCYRNVLMAYDNDHGKRVVTDMLRNHREPVTDVELDRMLMPPQPTGAERPLYPVTDATRGRQIMRRAWVESWCERHGKTEAQFWEEEAVHAKDERRITLKQQWARTDKIIADRKAKNLPVDESGLTNMAPVGLDPFMDDAEPPIKRRPNMLLDKPSVQRISIDPLDGFFTEQTA